MSATITECSACRRTQQWRCTAAPDRCSECGGVLVIKATITTETLTAPRAREVPRA